MITQYNKSSRKEKDMKNNYKSQLQGILIGLLSIGFILLQLLEKTLFENFLSLIILILMIWVLPSIRGAILYISCFLLISTVILLFYYSIPVSSWFSSLRINLPLIAVFSMVPLLSIPIKNGNYVNNLKLLFSRNTRNKSYYFYVGINTLTHLLSAVISIGSISIVSELVKTFQVKNRIILANAINRGSITSIYWSPYLSIMALILANLTIEWTSLISYSIGLVIISLVLSIVLDWREMRKIIPVQRDIDINIVETTEIKIARKNISKLVLYLIAIIGTVLLLGYVMTVSIVLVVCLVSLGLPFFWSIYFRESRFYIQELKRHIFVGLPRIRGEIILFLIAGCFSGAFINAGFGESLMLFIQQVFGSFKLGISLFLSIIIFSVALIGIHPIVVVTVFVTSIDPELIGLSPEYFALLLLTIFGVSNTISPSTAVNNLLAKLLNLQLIDVSLRANWKFALIMTLLIPVYLHLSGI